MIPELQVINKIVILEMMKVSKKDSLESSKGSISWKKHSRSQSTNCSKPRERSIRGIRESYLEEYMLFKEDKTEKYMANMMKLDYIIKNAKEISQILNVELPDPLSPQTCRSTRLKRDVNK